jgi:hypothetical protein
MSIEREEKLLKVGTALQDLLRGIANHKPAIDKSQLPRTQRPASKRTVAYYNLEYGKQMAALLRKWEAGGFKPLLISRASLRVTESVLRAMLTNSKLFVEDNFSEEDSHAYELALKARFTKDVDGYVMRLVDDIEMHDFVSAAFPFEEKERITNLFESFMEWLQSDKAPGSEFIKEGQMPMDEVRQIAALLKDIDETKTVFAWSDETLTQSRVRIVYTGWENE